MPLVNLLPQFESTGADACDDAAVDEGQLATEHNDVDVSLAQETRRQHAIVHCIEQCTAISLFHHHRKIKLFFYSQNDVTIRNTVATASRTACATSRHRPAIPPGGAHGYAERSTSPGILWIIHEKLFMPLQNDGLFVEKW